MAGTRPPDLSKSTIMSQSPVQKTINLPTKAGNTLILNQAEHFMRLQHRTPAQSAQSDKDRTTDTLGARLCDQTACRGKRPASSKQVVDQQDLGSRMEAVH